jgi:hypothetical protein
MRWFGASLTRRQLRSANQTGPSAGRGQDIGRILFGFVVAANMHPADATAAGIRFQLGDIGVGQKGEVVVRSAGWINRDELRIRLCIDRARKSVKGITEDSGAIGGSTLVWILIKLDAEWQMERAQPFSRQDVAESLDTRRMDDGRIGIRCLGPEFRWIFATLAVDAEEPFRLSIKRLRHDSRAARRAGLRPFDLAEVTLPRAKQGRAP